MILFTTARKLCGTASAVLLSLVLSARPAVAEIIPPGRTAPWQGNVGVPGGIPNRTKIYKNIVTDLGADPTGKVDAAPSSTRDQVLSGRSGRLHASGDVPRSPRRSIRLLKVISPSEERDRANEFFGTTNRLLSSAAASPWPPPAPAPPLPPAQQRE